MWPVGAVGSWPGSEASGAAGAGGQCVTSPPPPVVRKLNELYKDSVLSCQGLSQRLQRFFLDKQRLLDRIQSVSAEKLIFSHAVHTVSARRAGGGRGAEAHPWPRAPARRLSPQPGPPGRLPRPRVLLPKELPWAVPVAEMADRAVRVCLLLGRGRCWSSRSPGAARPRGPL